MNAKDLMVGDWVRNIYGVKGWVFDIRYYKDGFGERYVIKLAYDDKGESYACPEMDLIEPIPLTPEILEKNGFEKNKFVKCFSEYVLKKGESEIIVARGEIEEMWIRRTLAERAYCLPYPKYVHELQHALRLCGIDLDIKL